MVRGTGILQQYVDKQQLPREMDGDFHHCHSDWLVFRLVRIRFLVCVHVAKMILPIYLVAIMNNVFFNVMATKLKLLRGRLHG